LANVTPSGGLNLRKEAKPGKVIKVLRKGTSVEILGEQTWLKVKTKSGDVGFVSADFIDRNPEEMTLSNNQMISESASNPSEKCIIKKYTNGQFIGKDLYADEDFFPSLEKLNKFAKQCAVSIYVTSSAREPGRTVNGSIVTPASRSNHMIGHAIDMNLQSASGFYNSKKLRKSNFDQLPAEIKTFLNLVRADDTLRWGGDFNNEDPVHFDDNLNNINPILWDKKLASRK